MLIPEHEIKYSGYSILDSFGRVFFWKGAVYRGLTPEGIIEFETLGNSGLLAELAERNLIPQTTITDYVTKHFKQVLHHENIEPASFVYEWPFDMIKAAGHCILDINLIAAKYNYQTIDAHPYNVLFKGCNPVFIDLGSLKPVAHPGYWNALEEFNGYFKYPLEIWNRAGHKMARLLYDGDLNCISAAEYNNLVSAPALSNRAKAKTLLKKAKNKVYRAAAHQPTLLEKLNQCKVELGNLHRTNFKTQWGDYHNDYISGDGFVISDRFRYILNKIDDLKIETITELAGNWGLLSHLILDNTNVKHINCTDYDENAVNKMFNHFSNTQYSTRLSPALMDFIKPIELSNSGRPCTRFRSQAVLALAVTHHLILTYKYDINIIFEKIADFTSGYVFIEFMPLGLWNGTDAPPIPSFYTQAWFSRHFEEHFSLLDTAVIEENRVLYIGKKK